MRSDPTGSGTMTSPELPDSAIQEIRAVMRRNGAPDEVRHLIRVLCEAARSQQMSPEQLLVLFKTELARIPEVQGASDAAMTKFVAGIVTICIAEYYETRT